MGDPFGTGEKEMMKEDPGFARDPTDISKMCRVAYCGSANFGAQYQYRVPFDPAKDACAFWRLG